MPTFEVRFSKVFLNFDSSFGNYNLFNYVHVEI